MKHNFRAKEIHRVEYAGFSRCYISLFRLPNGFPALSPPRRGSSNMFIVQLIAVINRFALVLLKLLLRSVFLLHRLIPHYSLFGDISEYPLFSFLNMFDILPIFLKY